MLDWDCFAVPSSTNNEFRWISWGSIRIIHLVWDYMGFQLGLLGLACPMIAIEARNISAISLAFPEAFVIASLALFRTCPWQVAAGIP